MHAFICVTRDFLITLCFDEEHHRTSSSSYLKVGAVALLFQWHCFGVHGLTHFSVWRVILVRARLIMR